MKQAVQLICLTFTLVQALDHVEPTCKPSNFGDIFRGMALGIQKDHTNVLSDCYLHMDRSVYNAESFIRSFDEIIKYFEAITPEDLPERI